jgi:hypothetical protein
LAVQLDVAPRLVGPEEPHIDDLREAGARVKVGEDQRLVPALGEVGPVAGLE